MRSFLTTFLFAAAAIASASPVVAAETRVVAANRASAVFFYYTLGSSTCYPGAKPKFHVTSGPAHGNVASLWKAVKVGKAGGHCSNMPVHGTLVIYKPAPGYHGSDRVSFVFTENEGNDYFVRPKEFTLNITVK